FGMRRSVGLGLLLLTACGGGIKAPETIPVPPVGFVPLTPVDTAPTEGTPASAAAAGTRDARTAPAWPLSLPVKAVTGEHALTGHLSVGVPGTVAGLFEAHRQLGHLPWKDLVAPAVRLAHEGYTLDGVRSRQIGREAERLARFAASRAQFLSNGETPQPGSTFVQAELARTLQLIADSGPQVFYKGSIAELIVQEMARGGGLITRADLARYQ